MGRESLAILQTENRLGRVPNLPEADGQAGRRCPGAGVPDPINNRFDCVERDLAKREQL